MGPVTEEQQELVTMAVSNSEQLGRLVDDILDMERLDAGRMPLRPEPIDAVDLARQAVMGIAGAADAASVPVTLVTRGSGPTVLVDPHRMLQVLTNILGNAVKFSEAGAPIEVAVAEADDTVRISVTDHGRGIPAERVDSVFQPFGQVEAGDARRQGGTGLGLPIAKELVERSGGSIEVASEPGVGSTFTVVLPTAPRGPLVEVPRP